MSAAFILPFLQSVAEEDLLFEHKSYGSALNAFFFQIVPDNAVGIACVIGIVTVYVFWIIRKKGPLSRIIQLSCLPILFYTNLLPWKLLGRTPLSVIQFPWRFMIFMPALYFFIVLFLSQVDSVTVPYIGKLGKKAMRLLGVVSLVYCILLTSCMIVKLKLGYKWEILPIVTADNISSVEDIGLFEYLPVELAERRINRSVSESQNGDIILGGFGDGYGNFQDFDANYFKNSKKA